MVCFCAAGQILWHDFSSVGSPVDFCSDKALALQTLVCQRETALATRKDLATEPRRRRCRSAESPARLLFASALRPLPNSLPKVEPLSQDQIEAIHRSNTRWPRLAWKLFWRKRRLTYSKRRAQRSAISGCAFHPVWKSRYLTPCHPSFVSCP